MDLGQPSWASPSDAMQNGRRRSHGLTSGPQVSEGERPHEALIGGPCMSAAESAGNSQLTARSRSNGLH
jgi:hypothetical protein